MILYNLPFSWMITQLQAFLCLGLFFAVVSPCPHPFLPSTLDSYCFLGTGNQFHVANSYRANFTKTLEITSFTLTQRSNFRIYVAPSNVNIDLELFQGSTFIAVSYFRKTNKFCFLHSLRVHLLIHIKLKKLFLLRFILDPTL